MNTVWSAKARKIALIIALSLQGCAWAEQGPELTTVGDSNVGMVVEAQSANPLVQGYAFIETGKYRQALLEFDKALGQAQKEGDKVKEAEIYGAAGYAFYLMQKPEKAEEQLDVALQMAQETHDVHLESRVRAYQALVYAQSKNSGQLAIEELNKAQALAQAAKDSGLSYAIELQLARLESDSGKRLNKLKALADAISNADVEDASRLSLYLNLIDQLQQLAPHNQKSVQSGVLTNLNRSLLEKAEALARKTGSNRGVSQVLGYEAALATRLGNLDAAEPSYISAIQYADKANAPDLEMRWQKELGDVLAQQGREDEAIEAYRRSVFHVSEIRNDIPLVYQDGKSSYTETLEPIYRSLSGLLLRKASHTKPDEEEQKLLLEAINSMERLKQSELEDYFNDRCALDSAQSAMVAAPHVVNKFAIPVTSSGGSAIIKGLDMNLSRATGNTAILYPLMFTDRVELLLINGGHIYHQTAKTGRDEVTKVLLDLSRMLRKGESYKQIVKASHQMHQWLIDPLKNTLADTKINRVVYIPDGKLRLVPLSVFHDGSHFLVENYSIITDSGLQYLPTRDTDGENKNKALLAGLSLPDGPSVDQIPAELVFPESVNHTTRGMDTATPKATRAARAAEVDALKSAPDYRKKVTEKLALPGVNEEIQTIEQKMPNTKLLNQTFTSKNLEDGIQSGDYNLIHISSHGYFGHSADDSFILTYDKALHVNEMEQIMRSKSKEGNEIDLVIFSACQTAQGDDRAPLGFSGLAIKAEAKNALGALWPIDDKATKQFMKEYYSALAEFDQDPAKALQATQKFMLSNQALAHPSYWAAFVLVGAW